MTIQLLTDARYGRYTIPAGRIVSVFDSATEAGLIYCVEPIFASALALFLPALLSVWAGINYPNETATWTLLAGGGLITAANVLLQLRPPART